MSDQDFFFDEEEQPVEKPEAKSSASRAGAKPAAREAAPVAAQSISMSIAALIGVVALLAGIIIGILVPVGGSGVPAPTVNGTGAGATAPQLSPDQLNSGELPSGHPDIGDMTGAPAGEATGSAATTEAP